MAGEENVLERLDSELRFVELGGYGCFINTGQFTQLNLADSLTFFELSRSEQTRSCEDCHLFGPVSVERQLERITCHFIPPDNGGETIADLRPVTTQRRLSNMAKDRLRSGFSSLDWSPSRLVLFAENGGK